MRWFSKSALAVIALCACTTAASAAVNFTSPNPFDTNGYGPGESLVLGFRFGGQSRLFVFRRRSCRSAFPVWRPLPRAMRRNYGFAFPGFDSTFLVTSGSLSVAELLSRLAGRPITPSVLQRRDAGRFVHGQPADHPQSRQWRPNGRRHQPPLFLHLRRGGQCEPRGVQHAPQPAFEFDNIAAAISGVPEPSTWAMMILGFGLVGFSLAQ